MTSSRENSIKRLEWSSDVPLFRNIVFLRQLGIALGIPFGFLILVLLVMSIKNVYARHALSLISIVLLIAYLLMMLIYRKYGVEFVLNDKGVLYRTQAKQAKKNKVINTLCVILGLLSDKPGLIGAGLLAQSRQEVFLPWKRVTKVKYKPKSRTILLRGGWTENIALFCTDENYEQVEAFVRKRCHVVGQ